MEGAFDRALPRPLARALLPKVAAAAVWFAAPAAHASGLDAPFIGTGQSGPSTADATAVYWNPAELASLTRPELLVGAGLNFAHLGYQRHRRGIYQTPDTVNYRLPLPPGYVDPTKTGPAPDVTSNPIAPSGDAFFALPALRDRIVLGFGLYVPYAAALSFPKNGPQAYQIREALIVASHATASAGLRIDDRFAIGAGVSYVLGFAELSRLQDFAALAEFRRALETLEQANAFGPDAEPEVREIDVLSRPYSLKRAISHGVSFNAGVAYHPTRALSLSATYQHGAAMRYRGRFALDMRDDFFTGDLAPVGLLYKPFVQGDGELRLSLPPRVTVGSAYDIGARARVDGFVSYAFYSTVDRLEVISRSPDLRQPKLGIPAEVTVSLPRRWNDTVWAEAHGSVRLTDRLLVSSTLGYQSPASPDATVDTASLDGHRLLAGLGGIYDITETVSLYGDARLQGILPRTVSTSEHDLGNGTYRLFIGSVIGHLRMRF
jgi:long-chain fatty acid transport protein